MCPFNTTYCGHAEDPWLPPLEYFVLRRKATVRSFLFMTFITVILMDFCGSWIDFIAKFLQ